VFITTVVDTHKGHNIVCFDILGAFLHADLDKDIMMILKGRLAKLMVQVAPNLNRKYITVDRQGLATLYVKMQKAIYGLLRSAFLFYKKLVADLESIGFVLNPFDPFVANKVINGNQMTVCWHVDDPKVWTWKKSPSLAIGSAQPMEFLLPLTKVKRPITLE
jgi:hypothetical protein